MVPPYIEDGEGRITKRIYVGEYAGSHSVDRPRKKWIDIGKDCLRKKVWMLGKQREWCRIGVSGGNL